MVNTNLLSIRNVLVIAAFVIAWRIIMARTTSFLHAKAPAKASA